MYVAKRAVATLTKTTNKVVYLWMPAQRSFSEVHVIFCQYFFVNLFIYFYGRLMLRPRLTEVRETFTRNGP